MLSPKQRKIWNVAAFYFGWLACLWGARYNFPMAGPIYALCALAFHFGISRRRRAEMAFVLLMALIGAILDSSLMIFGLFEFRPIPLDITPPWWIAMWALFGLAIENSEILRPRLWLLMLVSGVTAPLSYFVGEFFDKIHYARPLWISLPFHALIWAALVPALFKLRDWCFRNFPENSNN